MTEPYTFDYCPWLFWDHATDEDRRAQELHQAGLRERTGLDAAGKVFLSPLAAVHTDRLRMGDFCYIAAHAYVTDDVSMGRTAPSTRTRWCGGGWSWGTRCGSGRTRPCWASTTAPRPTGLSSASRSPRRASGSGTTCGSARTSSCSTA
ncbi:hypothetical protein ACFQ0B_69025 [Nonomuraea thailandensis]